MLNGSKSEVAEAAGASTQEQVGVYMSEIVEVPLVTREGERDSARTLEVGAYLHAMRGRLSREGKRMPRAQDVLTACLRATADLPIARAGHLSTGRTWCGCVAALATSLGGVVPLDIVPRAPERSQCWPVSGGSGGGDR
jgi:hypothetical protein